MDDMSEKTLGRIITWIASLFIATASEFFPIPGMLAAALVFPQGIHSGHATAYLVLAMLLNFAIFFTITFLISRFFVRRLENPGNSS